MAEDKEVYRTRYILQKKFWILLTRLEHVETLVHSGVPVW